MPWVPEVTEKLGIRPAHLYVVDPALAARVAAPAYDTLPVGGHAAPPADPLNYLSVLRTPDRTGGPLRSALRDNRRTLQRMLGDGVFAGGGPRLAWYRLASPGHAQTGLIAEVAIRDYDTGRIVQHEHTRADREEQLAVYQDTVAADASPAALAYRANERMRELSRRATARAPHLRFVAEDGVEHALWTMEDTDDIDEVCSVAAALDRLYITDGHHRFAAASRVAASGRRTGGDPNASDQWLLAALFSDDELRILPFHRAVTRPRGMATQHLLAELAAHAQVTPLDGPAPPERSHEFSIWLDARWYRLAVPPDAVGSDPLSQLEVCVLQEHVLEPVFGVREPRLDPRLSYIAGGPAAVAPHCERTHSVGFMVRPTTMAQLMTVADAELVMPPKSTRFAPKVRAGLVLRLIR